MSETTSPSLFDGFDARVFEDPEFKEDAVREEIIAPILRRLGFSASGSNRLVRSRALVHPFVRIGSQKRRVNIIPDYLLLVDDRPVVVLDAKAPTEELLNSHHAEQVYSYAIHPDVRAPLYALCNGRRLVVWDREHFDPILDLDFRVFDTSWNKIEKALSPKAAAMPFTREFFPDLGMTLLKSGLADANFFWTEFPVCSIARPSDDQYSMSGILKSINLENGSLEEYVVTLDFGPAMFKQLLDLLPANLQSRVATSLTRQPYRADFGISEAPTVAVAAEIGKRAQGQFEEFVPFLVKELRPAMVDPKVAVTWITSPPKTL